MRRPRVRLAALDSLYAGAVAAKRIREPLLGMERRKVVPHMDKAGSAPRGGRKRDMICMGITRRNYAWNRPHAEEAEGVGAGRRARAGERNAEGESGRRRHARRRRSGEGRRHDEERHSARTAEARKTDGGRQGRRDGDQVARRSRPHAVHHTPITPQSTAQHPQRPHTDTPTLSTRPARPWRQRER